MKITTIIPIVSLVILVIIGTVWYLQGQGLESTDNITYLTIGNGTQVGGGVLNANFTPAAVITRTNEGYEPADITIKAGDTVMFMNESDSFHWPASDVHPTHSIYSDFDPREPVAPGDTWSFTFERPGSWRFHDHIRANLVGTIVVEE